MGLKPRPNRYVALLRGINVGGKNRLPMADLRAIFTALGAAEVTTYIQSGNVVFAAPPALAGGLAERVAEAIERRFDMRVPVVMREAGELAGVVARNPLAVHDPRLFHVMFLRDTPSAAAAAALDPDRSPGDRYALVGREIYVAYGDGSAKTRITNDYFDRTLSTVSTARNWRTVHTLIEMTAPP